MSVNSEYYHFCEYILKDVKFYPLAREILGQIRPDFNPIRPGLFSRLPGKGGGGAGGAQRSGCQKG